MAKETVVYWKHVATGAIQVVHGGIWFKGVSELCSKLNSGIATDQRFGIYAVAKLGGEHYYKFCRNLHDLLDVDDIPDELRLFILLSEEANDG